MANVLVIQNKRKFLQVCSDIGFVVSKTPVHYTRGTILSGKLSEGKTSSHPVFAHAFLIQMEKVQWKGGLAKSLDWCGCGSNRRSDCPNLEFAGCRSSSVEKICAKTLSYIKKYPTSIVLFTFCTYIFTYFYVLLGGSTKHRMRPRSALKVTRVAKWSGPRAWRLPHRKPIPPAWTLSHKSFHPSENAANTLWHSDISNSFATPWTFCIRMKWAWRQHGMNE